MLRHLSSGTWLGIADMFIVVVEADRLAGDERIRLANTRLSDECWAFRVSRLPYSAKQPRPENHNKENAIKSFGEKGTEPKMVEELRCAAECLL